MARSVQAEASREVRVGTLVPLANDNAGSSNGSVSTIPIFEGSNVVGRNHLVVTDKRISRKHLSLNASADGSIEVIVEGPNPIIVRSEGQRKKVCAQEKAKIAHDDILELIPGGYFVKYVDMADEHKSSVPIGSSSVKKGKRHSEEDTAAVKRNRQIMEDEALARTLQESFAEESTIVSDMASGQTSSLLDKAGSSKRSNERMHPVSPSNDVPSLTFRLMHVQGLPSWANSSSVTIQDVIQKMNPANWILHKPPLPISFGTHHSKAMLLVYPQGVRVVVHSANMIHVDWNNKSQGLWMQDFPWKDAKDTNKKVPFENDLVDYLSALKWPEFRVNLPVIGDVNINPAFFRRFDYSSSMVRLIGSVPGYHVGPNIKKWGHMKLRSVLEECVFEKQFCKSPLIYQFSSLGSLDEKWMSEFTYSLSAGKSDDGSPLGIGKPLIVWPTVEDVRCSIEGYAAGSCIPSPQKNVEKDFLRKYWTRWKADHVGRCRAMPHIKTFTRYNGQDISWFLLTSSNLSKAAWGALQKNNTQLMIRSYELKTMIYISSCEQSIIIMANSSSFDLFPVRMASPLARQSRPSWSRFAGKATKKRNHLRELSDCLCHINFLHNLMPHKLATLTNQVFMSDLDVQIPTAFDPFAEANAGDSGAAAGSKDYVHVRIQQRNGRKSLTTVQGLKKEFSYSKILKDLKKEFCCNGTVVQDPELGQVIQLQGDQRKNVSNFLVQAGIVKKEHIKIHGF
ncbi:Tyrosyl-DNA phosphodiesterase 1 [Dichanthelium oligosanthes]|nr:Tyrosyl-DNA phosphodiesterase 1 [Dichanthelium oligosanthes]